MARRPEISSEVALQPVAQPVDTYVAPKPAPRSDLWQLAESLSTLGGGLDKYIGGIREERQKKDVIRAQQAFESNNEQGYAEAVRSGAIPSFASKHFTDAYKAAEGRTSGNRLLAEFQLEYAKWDGKNSTDPNAFHAFYSDFVKQRVGTTDPAVLAGLLPILESGSEALGNAHIEHLANETYKEGVTAHAAEVSSTADQLTTEGLGRPEGTDFDGMWSGFMTARESAYASGVRHEDFDKQMFDMIAAKALEHPDDAEGFMKLLDKELPGQPGVKYSDTPEGQKLKADTLDKLEAMQVREDARSYQQQERDDKKAKEAATSAIQEQLAKHPGEPIPEAILAQAAKFDPEIRTKVLGWQKTFAEGTVSEEPQAIMEVYRAVLDGGGEAAVQDAIEAGVIRSSETLTKARQFAKDVEASGGAGGVLKSSQAKDIMEQIRVATIDNYDPTLSASSTSEAGFTAQYDFQRLVMDWTSRNPNASEVEKFEAVARIGKLVRDGITKEGDYTSPEAAKAFENPSRPQEAAPGWQTGLGVPGNPVPLGALPPEFRQKLEVEAGKRGRTAQEMADLYARWQDAVRRRAAEQPRPGATPTGTIDEQRGARQGAAAPSFDPESVRRFTDQLGVTDQLDKIADQFSRLPASDAAGFRTSGGRRNDGKNQVPNNPPGPYTGGFQEPTSNPNVNQTVLAKYKGRRLPVVIRNNNPAALSLMHPGSGREFAEKQPGYIGATPRPKAEGGYYAKFATPEHGVYANAQLLRSYGKKGANTAARIVRRWSTDKNAWAAYASKVAAAVGVGVNDPMDLDDPKVLAAILMAKSAHESGTGRPIYTADTFSRGVTGQFLRATA